MARRILNRKELREESEAAQRIERAEQGEQKEVKKPPSNRKSRAKAPKEVRAKKAFWGVFNQTMTQVAIFEYSQEKQAREKANELSESKKTPHFVQLVKKDIDE